MLWVLLFVGIGVGGLVVLGLLLLRLWRKAGALLGEVDVLSGRVGELADLLARVEVPRVTGWDADDKTPGRAPDDAWPGTVETYDDQGASASGKKEP